jgi:hypothetical protein
MQKYHDLYLKALLADFLANKIYFKKIKKEVLPIKS